ncbi:hypothetical protein L1889_18230 [Paenalcaligenes niemegkensis]|uniref:hypothetical protein n=1 Tax=Paenalcaligenes niemegkensis TaxID=2895469 RepID=UPI001EE822EC|nr:hypothetical protein [Paenalcaligenes niemegkensis]MCQ9618378.1 hypothetical protein [Paenalcaligenes niemegkensis]
MNTVAILAFGSFFIMIGFGLGLLAFYFETQKTPHVPQYPPIDLELNNESAVTAWAAVYEQSAETLRDTVKMLSGANIAGLATCAAIIASKQGLSGWPIYASAGVFVIGLVATILPNAGLSEKYREDSAAILQSIKMGSNQPTPMPDAWPTGHRRLMQSFSLASIFFGTLFLIFALMKLANS